MQIIHMHIMMVITIAINLVNFLLIFRSPFGSKRLVETAMIGLPWFENFRPLNSVSHPFGRFTFGASLFYGHIITCGSYKSGYILHEHIHFFKKINQFSPKLIFFIKAQNNRSANSGRKCRSSFHLYGYHLAGEKSPVLGGAPPNRGI